MMKYRRLFPRLIQIIVLTGRLCIIPMTTRMALPSTVPN